VQIKIMSLAQTRDVLKGEESKLWSNIGNNYLTQREHACLSFMDGKKWSKAIENMNLPTSEGGFPPTAAFQNTINMGHRIFESPSKVKRGDVIHFFKANAPLTVSPQ